MVRPKKAFNKNRLQEIEAIKKKLEQLSSQLDTGDILIRQLLLAEERKYKNRLKDLQKSNKMKGE